MSKHGKTSMSPTLVAGSEEDFDVICDPCNSDGQRVQATGHCIDCNENMCVSCMKFHKKLAVVKDHVIQDKSTLSQSQKARGKANRPAEDNDPLTDKCPKHPDELIKFYCNSHSTLGCSDCVSLDHRSCKDILYIKDVSGAISNSDELTKVQTELQMLVARLTSIQSRIKWFKHNVNDSYSQTVSDIRNLKRELIDKLDQFENEMLEEASRMKDDKIEALDNQVPACDNLIRETEKLYADMEKKKAKGQHNKLFISLKSSQRRILDLDEEADDLCYKSNYERLSFHPDGQLTNLLSTLTGLGEMIQVSQTKDVRAKYQRDINIKSDTDTKQCGISGIAVLSDGRLVLSDIANMSVKLVDVTKHKVVEQIKQEPIPLDLAIISNDKVAATLKDERYIQVFSVFPSLSKSHTIAVPGLYRCIEYIPDKLILVCKEPTTAIHICDMSGTVLHQIETDFGGNKLFTEAKRISISPDNSVMYVSDFPDHTVVCLTMDGKLISKYFSDTLKRPTGITFDDNGFAYVCSLGTHTIHQLSPSGNLVKVLLSEKDEILVPFAIAYRAGHLYISSGSHKDRYGNNVKVYRLDQ